ncbi:SEC-C motif protein [Desulfosarcina variabilis str. Montpellier]|uniref:tetratricopeptide repeat protein n=1 Tax=Desulfosarcina variabilis TaxID=2300 RepID=UPI003AFA681C
MGKISRNAPCPCGSGKKYKKCCLQKDETKSISQRAPSQKTEESSFQDLEELYAYCEALDNLSNSVVDLIHEGKLDDAEQACIELLKNYPDSVDGLERYAMVYEARGDSEKAIEYYKRTADFARSKEGFDPEFVKWALDKVKLLSA